jgi:hypothetical protein
MNVLQEQALSLDYLKVIELFGEFKQLKQKIMLY